MTVTLTPKQAVAAEGSDETMQGVLQVLQGIKLLLEQQQQQLSALQVQSQVQSTNAIDVEPPQTDLESFGKTEPSRMRRGSVDVIESVREKRPPPLDHQPVGADAEPSTSSEEETIFPSRALDHSDTSLVNKNCKG